MDTERLHRPPEIDYLAKDYASFRQLLLDQLSLFAPGWQERSAADLGHVLVDILAYAADYLSYYQDAVATETYLGTARHRRSVRRHARLLDYHLHDGCNARTWVHVEVAAGGEICLPAGTMLLTHLDRDGTSPVIDGADPRVAAGFEAGEHQAFETMHDCRLLAAHNEIAFHTESSDDRLLRRGATTAQLADPAIDPSGTRRLDNLRAGDLILFEELLDPTTGRPGSGDPRHRHVVRLTEVARSLAADGDAYVKIAWDAADALPFDLPVGSYHAVVGHKHLQISVARGNLALADHGWRIRDEVLPPARGQIRYRPYLRHRHITSVAAYDHAASLRLPAAHALRQNPQETMAAIQLVEIHDYVLDAHGGTPALLPENARGQEGGVYHVRHEWSLRRELLSSEFFARDYVVETEEDGRAHLRFGFGGMGRHPAPGGTLSATYRVGRATDGNVGREAIAHLVGGDPAIKGAVLRVRNPLPVTGGTGPEQLEEARLNAPHAHKLALSCITAGDYAALAARHPAVRRARAELKTTGSWTTARVYVERRDRKPVDGELERTLREFLLPMAMAGHQVVVTGARTVGLDLDLRVLVAPGSFRLAVRQAIEGELGTGRLRDGRTGFFHPDNLDFGQPVYRSQVIDRVMAVAGVARVDVERLSRSGKPGDSDPVHIAPFEIARLDADSTRPENGRLTLVVEGGR